MVCDDFWLKVRCAMPLLRTSFRLRRPKRRSSPSPGLRRAAEKRFLPAKRTTPGERTTPGSAV